MSDMHITHRKEFGYEKEEAHIVADSPLEAEDKP